MKKVLLALMILPIGAMAQDSPEPLETVFQKFAFSLFDKVTEDIPQNVVFSPLSAQVALSMAQNGADGNTLLQMQEAMGTTDYTTEQLNDYYKSLYGQLTSRPPFVYDPNYCTEEEARERYDSEFPICELSNALWTALPAYESFTNLLRNDYQAEVASVDFGTQEGIDIINQWVNDKTHGLIPLILEEPNDLIIYLLANALYFKGGWKNPFNEEDTYKGIFHVSEGNDVEVDMMQTVEYFRCNTTDRFKSVTLPYGYGDFSMTVFLPETLELPSLTYDDWQAAMNSNTWPYLRLHLPKFEIDSKLSLNEALKALGIVDAFGVYANFQKMCDFAIFIDEVKQLAKIIVDEKGTEAAAVTVMQFDGWSGEPETIEELCIDRPFYFTIEHKPTHTVLFVGRMTKLQGNALSPEGISSTPDNPNILSSPWYDLSGRQLTNAPQKGLYIKDGKTHAVK